MMTGCDTLLMIGSGFPYSEFLPKEGAARGVQIDLKPDMLSLRYPMEINLTGDSVETLRALLPLLEEKADRSWRREIEKNVAACGSCRKRARCRAPNPSIRSASPGSCRLACQSGRLSPAIRDRAQTGMRATSGSGAG